jgi:hypothetical protein
MAWAENGRVQDRAGDHVDPAVAVDVVRRAAHIRFPPTQWMAHPVVGATVFPPENFPGLLFGVIRLAGNPVEIAVTIDVNERGLAEGRTKSVDAMNRETWKLRHAG